MSDTRQARQRLFKQGITDQEEIDEAMLRFYVYGSTDKRASCNIIKRIYEDRTYKKMFPRKFATAPIEHLIKCEACFKYYESQYGEDTEDG